MTTGRISFWSAILDNNWSLDNNRSLNTFVWNKVSRPIIQAFQSFFSCVLFALRYVNSESISDIFIAQCDLQHENYCSVRF